MLAQPTFQSGALQLVSHLYNFVSMTVMFHQMGKRVQEFFAFISLECLATGWMGLQYHANCYNRFAGERR
jgi:hypothetical protein